MCLIFMALDAHPRFRLLVAANRDEFHTRATAPVAAWSNDGDSDIIAGRDLVAGGTWMGMTRSGRFGALTNYRGPALSDPNPPSRGHLVTDFLASDLSAARYCDELRAEGHRYNGYSLLAYDGESMCCYSNRADEFTELASGVHGLSNHLLNSPWPKVTRGVDAIERELVADRSDEALVETLFAMLKDSHRPRDEELPDTGVGVERERELAPMFVLGEAYGTRSSTVLAVEGNGEAWMHERTYDAHARETGRVSQTWSLGVAAAGTH